MERYSEYKDSGVKWLGEIPSHWEVMPIKHSYKFTVGWTPPTGRNDLFEGNNLWANISDLGKKEINNTANRISDSAVRLSGRSMSPKGSLLYSFKLSVGTVSFCGADMYTNEAIATFLKGKNSLKYLYYAAPIFIIKNANTNIYGAPILNQDLIKNALVLLPPRSEQDAIVRYLDAATSKIDKAIDMQQKMIDLLNERKQIIVQNAVTKGLDDKVEMKDSGVEWIGMIPKHWKIIRLKNVFYKRIAGSWGNEQNVSPKNTVCLRIADFEYSRLQFKKRENYTIRSYTAKEIENKKLSKGDLLIEKSGGGEKSPVGRCVVYNLEIPDVMYANFMEKLSTRGNVDSYFICYLLSCFYSQGMIWPYVKATTGIQNLDIASLLSKEYIFVPPKSEQQAIVAYLDKQMQRFDSAITNCQRQITLLQERKQIIINEVVTGKVKVS